MRYLSLRIPPLRAFAWLRAILRVRRLYRAAHSRAPHLLAPRRFTEKMQWRKLFDLNPQFTTLCDKLAVRGYIAERGGGAHLVPLLWSGAPEDIPWQDLQPPYVLKSTHASGQVIFVDANMPIDRDAIRDTASAWLAKPHGVRRGEIGYLDVPRRIIAERKIAWPAGALQTEVRFFMFDGKVGVINTVIRENGRLRNGAFHREDWTRLDWRFTRVVEIDFPPPRRLRDMIAIAERASAGLDHVRVDFYDCGETFWIGEMTLYSWSGYSRFVPDEADFILGNAWRLERPFRRAISTVLWKERRIASPGRTLASETR